MNVTSGDSSDKMTAPRVSTWITFADGKYGEDISSDDNNGNDNPDNSAGVHSGCSTEIISTVRTIAHHLRCVPHNL
jgi:hypothetical protein